MRLYTETIRFLYYVQKHGGRWTCIYENGAELLAANLNFAELGVKMPIFRKIWNFIKSERIDEYFPNPIPSVMKHLWLHKELFISVA